MPAGTWALTVYIVRAMDGRITYWNRGAEELYGWTADEAFGRIAPELLHTTYPGPLPDINADPLRTGSGQGELVQTTRGGKRVVVASRGVTRQRPPDSEEVGW